eukprot:CAMPEP_0171987056 /NCGR_PEP_ID=MMETSP0993-20121228/275191_1 /TAXON_ID=483369 /ORGANISM="non described non described, Strain CCMP2098" /LENGTH=889 /DNA_ID=CAMNT_0012639987 /DNA_START=90 /DNA_END=2760 /DNA_ORIENTATION=-
MKQRAKLSTKSGDTLGIQVQDLDGTVDEDDPKSPSSPRKLSTKDAYRSPSSTSSSDMNKDQKAIFRPPIAAGCVGRGWGTMSTTGRVAANLTLTLVRASLKHWFLVCTALSIVLAQARPWLGSDFGPLKPQVTVKYGAIMSIFFISGVTMRTEAMWETFKDWRQHVFIQSFSLVASPLLVRCLLVPALRYGAAGWMPEPLVQGFMVVGCMPPPVSTSVMLTKAAAGNEASAVFNSALGSFLGVVLTPLLLLWLVDPNATGEEAEGELGLLDNGGEVSSPSPNSSRATHDSGGGETKGSDAALLLNIMKELSVTVVAPLMAGQLLRSHSKTSFVGKAADQWKPQLGVFSSLTLLLIIYTTFCNTFCQGTCHHGEHNDHHHLYSGDDDYDAGSQISADSAASSAAAASALSSSPSFAVATSGGSTGAAAAAAAAAVAAATHGLRSGRHLLVVAASMLSGELSGGDVAPHARQVPPLPGMAPPLQSPFPERAGGRDLKSVGLRGGALGEVSLRGRFEAAAHALRSKEEAVAHASSLLFAAEGGEAVAQQQEQEQEPQQERQQQKVPPLPPTAPLSLSTSFPERAGGRDLKSVGLRGGALGEVSLRGRFEAAAHALRSKEEAVAHASSLLFAAARGGSGGAATGAGAGATTGAATAESGEGLHREGMSADAASGAHSGRSRRSSSSGEGAAKGVGGEAGVFDQISTSVLLGTSALVVALQLVYMYTVFQLATNAHKVCGGSSGSRGESGSGSGNGSGSGLSGDGDKSSDKGKEDSNGKKGFTRADVVSVLFSSVHKSLTLGIPVLKIVFKDSKSLPLLSMPLLMYHPIQIVLGGLAAPSLKAWVLAESPPSAASSPSDDGGGPSDGEMGMLPPTREGIEASSGTLLPLHAFEN